MLSDSTEQSEHLVVAEGLVGHRSQQDTDRTGFLRAVHMGEDARRAQVADSDEYRSRSGVLDGDAGYPSTLGRREVRIGTGRTQGGDGIHPGCSEPFDEAGEGALIDDVVTKRREGEGTQPGETDRGRTTLLVRLLHDAPITRRETLTSEPRALSA